ncbi:hypothetical protein GCM10011519_18010 [Marmoricola endophyticus]|uniref:DUF3311 domain-containing protein n=1 Tax=Marmoricola endophyticus TaxID=2040280 RepID=A0A917F387_9ACTN|nr:DUF3311 domain-containing protein [Marmoricola endophyticus]GGF44523.1 hypothetical protein GCM10011519_18010 [Marmoricola endophyticus]
MSTTPPGADSPGSDSPPVPRTDRTKMVLAGICLLIPIVALMWVPSYAKDDPELWGFPFFFWYQFLWVFLCSGLTWTAYKLTLAARRAPKGGAR